MSDPAEPGLRELCQSRGLCEAAAFDAAVRTRDDMAARGERLALADVLVLVGAVSPEHTGLLRRAAAQPAAMAPAVAGVAAAPSPVAAAPAWEPAPDAAPHAAPSDAPAPARAMSADDLAGGLPGRELGGCRILRVTGRSPLAVVCEAEDLTLRRRVEVNVLVVGGRRSESDAAQFLAEHRLLARAAHPNVRRVLDSGEEDGLRFVVLETAAGETLAARLARSGALPWEEACRIARDVARGLGAAHALGIVHRDVRPAHVHLAAADAARISGFAFASRTADAAAEAARDVAGSPSHLAPEQVDGRVPDRRADLYSLGCTLFEMLTGRPPFEAPSAAETMLRHARDAAPHACRAKSSVPPAVSEVVDRLLAKSPAARPSTAEEVVADLDRVLAGGAPGPAAPAATASDTELSLDVSETPRPAWSRPHVVLAGGALAVGAAVAIAFAALPSVTTFEVDRDALLAAADVRTPEEEAAHAAIADAESFALRCGDDLAPALARFDEVARRHGDVAGPDVQASRDAAVHRWEKRRDEAIAAARAKSRSAASPLASVQALLALPEKLRRGGDLAAWAQDLDRASAALRAATGMAYVPGGRAATGRDGAPADVAPFLVDVYEVSNADYARFVEETGARPPRHWGGNVPPASERDHPVVGVTATEADAYAAWAGKRLPTALEWERAARGAEGLRYPWGGEFDASRCVARGDPAGGLVSVASHPTGRSPAGAHHMAGNAAEWVAGSDAAEREVRGGSAASHPSHCAAFVRYSLAAQCDDPALLVGFRCAQDAR